MVVVAAAVAVLVEKKKCCAFLGCHWDVLVMGFVVVVVVWLALLFARLPVVFERIDEGHLFHHHCSCLFRDDAVWGSASFDVVLVVLVFLVLLWCSDIEHNSWFPKEL